MEFLVTLGNEALQTVIADAHVSDFHGMTSKMKLNGRFITHFVMFHPAAMLYDSRVRERFWRDAHELAKLLKEERKGS
jgi:uracil-DNA glycosylase